ncbi:hypothetical protein NL676_030177 [Syzygium grande]|nr:hypothetical protein NL676_030177 [Syzygium grande]
MAGHLTIPMEPSSPTQSLALASVKQPKAPSKQVPGSNVRLLGNLVQPTLAAIVEQKSHTIEANVGGPSSVHPVAPKQSPAE